MGWSSTKQTSSSCRNVTGSRNFIAENCSFSIKEQSITRRLIIFRWAIVIILHHSVVVVLISSHILIFFPDTTGPIGIKLGIWMFICSFLGSYCINRIAGIIINLSCDRSRVRAPFVDSKQRLQHWYLLLNCFHHDITETLFIWSKTTINDSPYFILRSVVCDGHLGFSVKLKFCREPSKEQSCQVLQNI